MVPLEVSKPACRGGWLNGRAAKYSEVSLRVCVGPAGTAPRIGWSAAEPRNFQRARRAFRSVSRRCHSSCLAGAPTQRQLQNVTAATSGPKLVVVDEPGYFALPAGAAELVLQVISERNGRVSMIVSRSASGPRCFPTPASRKPSSTASPIEQTSSTSVPVMISGTPACQRIGDCSVPRRRVVRAECGRPSAELAHARASNGRLPTAAVASVTMSGPVRLGAGARFAVTCRARRSRLACTGRG